MVHYPVGSFLPSNIMWGCLQAALVKRWLASLVKNVCWFMLVWLRSLLENWAISGPIATAFEKVMNTQKPLQGGGMGLGAVKENIHPSGHLVLRFMAWEDDEVSQVFTRGDADAIKPLIMSLAQFTWKVKGRDQEKKWLLSSDLSRK